MALNSHILKVIVGERFPSSSVDDHGRDVSNMTEESKRKIRYCGAWTIAKVRNACREYFKTNIYSANADVRFKAKEAYDKSHLVERQCSTAFKLSRYSKCDIVQKNMTKVLLFTSRMKCLSGSLN